jgi:NAD(P)-dependent dehydrogenase (short-subunit alcohol dehydrogenase family)
LHHLSRHLAGRLGVEGITSNSIACGPFATKSECCLCDVYWRILTNALVMAFTLKQEGENTVKNIPLTRIGADEDVAGTAMFLASPAGRYVTGATIPLDGGILVNFPKEKIPLAGKAKL